MFVRYLSVVVLEKNVAVTQRVLRGIIFNKLYLITYVLNYLIQFAKFTISNKRKD
jgi:hypothetical protein